MSASELETVGYYTRRVGYHAQRLREGSFGIGILPVKKISSYAKNTRPAIEVLIVRELASIITFQLAALSSRVLDVQD